MNESANITQFPNFNLSNIPEALRKVANDIEANPEYCDYIVLCGRNKDGTWYKAFGPYVTKLDAIAVIEFAKFDILGLLK